MKARVALFGWTRFPDWEPHAAVIGPDGRHSESTTFVQITEAVEVEFPELDEPTKLQKRIQSLRADRLYTLQDRDKKTADVDARLKQIDEELAKLEATSGPQAGDERPTA